MNRLSLVIIFATAVSCRGESDIFFDPPVVGASVSFEGRTQVGNDVHRFEVRQLAYTDPRADQTLVTSKSCVIYYAGREYGPQILLVMEAISPLVRKTAKDRIDVYCSRGVSRHIRQQWKLLGNTAELLKEEDIDWRDDPRMTAPKPVSNK